MSKCHFVCVVPWRDILKYLQKFEGCTHFCDTLNIRTSKDFFKKYIYLTLFVTFACERELETEQNCNRLTPTLMTVSVLSFSFSRAAQSEAQRPSSLLDDGFLYCILSPTGLQNSIGVPTAPSAGCGFPYHILSPTSLNPNSSGAPRAPSAGLSLPHLISNFSGPQLNRGLWTPSAWCGFPYHISSLTPSVSNCLTSCLDRVI